MEETRRPRQGGYVYPYNGIWSKFLIPCEDRLLLRGREHSTISHPAGNIAAQYHSISYCHLDSKHFLRAIKGRRSHKHFSQPQDFSREVCLPRQSYPCHTDMISTASFGFERLAAAFGVNHPFSEAARWFIENIWGKLLIGEALRISCKICIGKHSHITNWIANIIASSCIRKYGFCIITKWELSVSKSL